MRRARRLMTRAVRRLTSRASERASDAEVRDRAAGECAAPVVAACDTCRCGEGEIETCDKVGGQLGAIRRLDRVGVKRGCPRVARVGDDSGVECVQEKGPRADAALGSNERPPVLDVYQRDVRACVAAGGKPRNRLIALLPKSTTLGF